MWPFLQILYLENVHVHSQIYQETKSGIASTEGCFHDLCYYIFSMFWAERQCFKDCKDMQNFNVEGGMILRFLFLMTFFFCLLGFFSPFFVKIQLLGEDGGQILGRCMMYPPRICSPEFNNNFYQIQPGKRSY